MADALLDTTFFIDLHRGDEGAMRIWDMILNREISASYSVLTIFELWVGSGSTRVEELFYESLFEHLDLATLTKEASSRAAFWIRSIRTSVPEALTRDAMIAATAVERGKPVYTRNVRDFQRFAVQTVRY